MRIADRRQRSGVQIRGEFHSFSFSKRNKHNNTVGKTRHEAFLNSNCYWDWIKNTQEIRQWKSLKLDQLTYAERSREHSGLPNNSNSPYGLCGRKATLNWNDPLCSRPLPVHSFACSYWLITLSSCMIQLLITPRLLVMNSSWPQLEKNGGGDSSVVRAPDSWLKGRGFESLLEWRENFLLQGRLSVLTLISVSVPPPCYHSST